MNNSNYDALDLANQIKAGEFSIEELVNRTLRLAEEKNISLNAIPQIFPEPFIENQILTLDKQAIYAGIPLFIKDLGVGIEGFKATYGSYLFQDFITPIESEIIKRFKKAGFILVGKSATPEMGLSYVTESKLLGVTRNPLDLSKTPGGSSGGASALVASGISPLAHASDGGGSVRVPAACCGLIGLKPTRARIPAGPLLGEIWSGMGTQFVITKSVRDSAICLDILSGASIGDPYCAPTYEKKSWYSALEEPFKKLKIAYSTRSFYDNLVAPECHTALRKALNKFEQAGHFVENAWPTFDEEAMMSALKVIICTNSAWVVSSREKQLKRKARVDELESTTWLLVEQGLQFSAQDYAEAIYQMHAQSRIISEFFEQFDILLTPALAKLPLDIGHFSSQNFLTEEAYSIAMNEFSPFTALWNQTGQPAITFPCFSTEEGFPVSVQAVGRFGDEELLLKIARFFERGF